MDSRIAGVPLSAVDPQKIIRENKVKRLIEKFENHKNKDSLIQDLRQTEKINKFSEESQDLIADKNNTEISSSFAKTLPKSNAPIAISTGKSALSIAVVGDFKNLRRDQKSSKRTTTTSPQSPAMLLRRTAVAMPNMDLLNDKECTTSLKRCCKKLVKNSTEAIHPCLHDGTTTTNTEIRCHSLDGPSRKKCYLTELPCRIFLRRDKS